ncbi:MAG TPA: sugar phosphate nucleotidyltransferase [Bacteroidota bacterium]|jgi:glucose-1-phosphate thymidylyltransferase|nr:sugar phosphate nucleotidyltransferase [Bacteroidota bacterium]
MRAIIPVAGFGSRLRPHTYTLPKVLLNVAGKPIIGHILDKIIEDGFDEATIIVGHLGDMIRDYVLSHYKLKLDFVEQKEAKGLAHAIYLARGTFSNEPILIILGDTIFDVNLKPVMKEKCSAIGVKEVEDPRRFGVVESRDGFVSRLIEKPEHPPSKHAIVGLYWISNPLLLEKCICELFEKDARTKGEYQLTDALQLMIQHGEKIRTFDVEGWYDCGKPETLLSTNRHLLERLDQQVKLDGVVVNSPVYVSDRAKITNSVIGPFATIAEGAVVGDSIVRNSIVSEDAHVYKALLENSIVGNSALVQGNFKRINIGDSSEIEFH